MANWSKRGILQASDGHEETETHEAKTSEFRRTAIWGVMDLLPRALERVAPRRYEQLLEAVEGICLELRACPEWIGRYDPETVTIVVSDRLVEALWCASYAYYNLYKIMAEGRQFDSPVERVLTEIPGLNRISLA